MTAPLCGWCATANHTPSPTSIGCIRYHGSSSRPCPCTAPVHEETSS